MGYMIRIIQISILVIYLFILYQTNIWYDENCYDLYKEELSCNSKKQWAWIAETTIISILYFIVFLFKKHQEKIKKKSLLSTKNNIPFKKNEDLKNKSNKFCTNCGNKLNLKNKFCGNCGLELKNSPIDTLIEKKNKYTLGNNSPSTININENKLYKKDLDGLKSYFKEMKNMERIFNEMTYSIRNGMTVGSYLKKSKLLEDREVSIVLLKGFTDIKEFLEGMYSLHENDELKKDISACYEAIEIIQKNI